MSVPTSTTAALRAAEDSRPRYNRADLIQRERVTLSHFAWLLDVSRAQVVRLSERPETGFLYQPVYTDTAGRDWYAPWQLGLIAGVSMEALDLETARRTREVKRLAMIDPVGAVAGAAVRAVRLGRPRKQPESDRG